VNIRPRPWIASRNRYEPGLPARLEEGRLASNESAFPPPRGVVEAIENEALGVHRYPDPLASPLRAQLARRHGVEPTQILIANGSDELIYLLVMAYAAGGGSVVCADPPYGLHALVPQWMGASVTRVPLADWKHDLEAMTSVDADLAFVCNPHNPTGTLVSEQDLGRFVGRSAAGLVVIDEAYIDFTDSPERVTMLRRAADGEAVVLRTFSKVFGLAGLRLGYLVGPEEIVDTLQLIRPPFSVNALGQAAAAAALRDTHHVAHVRQETIRLRGRMEEVLREAGYATVPSQTNFVLVFVPDESAFVAALSAEGVSVRRGAALGVPGAVRVTVPSEEGLRLLQAALSRMESLALPRPGTPDA
jgi:histidinol-phosphate aminotransferase